MNQQWKIKRDPFYADLFAQKGFEFIESAGFFYDSDTVNRDIEQSLDLLCTPIGFDIDPTKKSCVLLTTGSFCPMHFGHRDMLIKAKHHLEQNGWQVLKAYISPGHDEYIQKKCGDQWLNIDQRIQLIQTIIAEDDWLAIDSWEGIFNQVAVNFTDVIYRLQLYLQKHLDRDIPVFYVCGSDNARFAQTFLNKEHCVVVGRPGYQTEFEQYQQLVSERIKFIEGDADISSSLMRKIKPEIRKRVSLNLICQSHPLEDNLISLMSDYYQEVRPEILNQSKHCDDLLPCISLDSSITAEYQLSISRLFDLGGIGFRGFSSRPGTLTIDQQVELIPSGHYRLKDTDIFSGKTSKFLVELLATKKIWIDKIETLLESCGNEILDARDFFLGATDSGLVMQLPNGQISRAPYVLPYVNPAVRCSLENTLAFSIRIWKMNRDYFFGKPDRLSSLKTNKALFLYMGFSESDSLAEIADWHYQKLRQFLVD
jgi:nicotinic acid mononucleotide adenylyltransferase